MTDSLWRKRQEPERSMKVEGLLHVVCQCDQCKAQPEQEYHAVNAVHKGQQCYVKAQPEQEPVFWWNGGTQFATQKSKDWDKRTGGTTAFGCDIPLYTTPPQRTWVGLEGEEIRNLWEEVTKPDRSTMTLVTSLAKAIEAKLKQKNGYAEE